MNWPPFFRFSDVDALFDAVQKALEKSTEWRLRECENLGSDRFLSVDYVGKKFDGRDFGFVLCSFPDEPSEVQLTMHAVRWKEDRSHPSDAEYMSAERMTAPLFREVARILKRPLRLSRPRERKHLVGKLRERFSGFSARASDHWNGGKVRHLHQTENEDFYQFICAAHRTASALTPEELFSELRKAGFNEELSKQLMDHYEIGRRILAMGTWKWHRSTVDVWNPWNVREDRKRAKARRRERDEAERRRAS